MSVGRRVLAAVALLLVGARAQGLCGSDIKGVQTNLPVQLPNVTLTPGIRDSNITVKKPNDPPQCPPQTEHVGTMLVACDWDSQPAAELVDLVRGTVRRAGGLAQPGVVITILFCKFMYSFLRSMNEKVAKVDHGPAPSVLQAWVPKTSASGSAGSAMWLKHRSK